MNLTAPPIELSLTANFPKTSDVTFIAGVENWLSSAGNQMKDNAGNNLTFARAVDGKAILLTAPPVELGLTEV